MTIEAIVLITLVVGALGAITTQLFRHTASPYLITVTGTRGQIFTAGAMIWIGAIVLGLAAMFLLSAVASNLVGLAIFFGIEAVALDICANRTQYVRVERSASNRATVSAATRS